MRSSASSGQILVITLVVMLIIMALGGVLVSTVLIYSQHGKLAYAQERALQLAEAGVDKAIYQINQGAAYNGESDVPLGSGTFSVTVTDASRKKIIESTGYVPSASSPQAKRTVRVELVTSSAAASFLYGVQVGDGGFIMGNNSSISGSIYSNGSISGAAGALISGDAWIAGGISPVPDQQQALQTGEQNVGDASARVDAAQSFETSETHAISRVSIFVRKVGNSPNAIIRIVPDSGGSPSKITIASGTLNASSVGTNYGWIDVSFNTNPVLLAGERYWLVMDLPSANVSRYYVWGMHENSGYGNGIGMYSANFSATPSVWNPANGDFSFKTWMGSGVTSATAVSTGGDLHANTIADSTVGRDAFYQTISRSSVAGNSNPGTADPPALDMPISLSVVEDFKAAAVAGGTITPAGGTYVISGINTTLGPKKIAGDLLISNGAVLTLRGTLWVEGDIVLDNNSRLRLDPGYGSDSGIIIADYPDNPYVKGKIIVQNNSLIEGSGDPDSYIMVLSTFADPISYAIEVGNNSTGAIFYSTAGTVRVNNNVSLKEVLSYRLLLANNASVLYESGLANVQFSAGPAGGWILRKGSWHLLQQ